MRLFNDRDDEPDILKGFFAGIAGGLVAALVMEQFQVLWSKAATRLQHRVKSRAKPSTVKAADLISQKVVGRKVPKNRQRLAGEAVHYAMGATSGAIYGVAAECVPRATSVDGLAFGTAVWVIADEISVPALGLSKPVTKVPASTHIHALASHLVYGWVAEIVRSTVRKVF